MQANEPDACSTSITTTIYRGKVSAAAELGVDDWVFSDNTGGTKLDDGYYGVTVATGHVAVEVSNGLFFLSHLLVDHKINNNGRLYIIIQQQYRGVALVL